MWNNNLVRLVGALLAVALITAACASASPTATADATGEAITESPLEENDSEDAAPDDGASDAGPEPGDHEAADHGDLGAASHDDDSNSHAHDHGDDGIEVDASLPIPALDIELTETATLGTFVVEVSLENFTITPDNIDADPIDNEGHLHLYLDGDRVTRFTDLEIEIEVPDGEHLVEVELSANNHSAYLLNGEPIRAGATVTGSGEAPEPEPAPDASSADAIVTATFVGGSVDLDGPDRIEVSQGDVVMVMITSDAVDEIHVHGYDLFADVAPDVDAMIVFTADTQGRFEIEFEQSGQFIAELVVS